MNQKNGNAGKVQRDLSFSFTERNAYINIYINIYIYIYIQILIHEIKDVDIVTWYLG